ncbi:MAG: penicillin acylase family protein [Gemmatimonadetes bacterium]|nr:penicillin acylase family protein [Gemmatimonadota bacterium]
MGRLPSIPAFLGLLLVLWSCAPAREEIPSPPTPTPATPTPEEPLTPEIGSPELPPLAQAVEIRRTSYGVPHILAESLESAAFGLAWVMMEDYREDVPAQILGANGRWAATAGRTAVPGDFIGKLTHHYAMEVFPDFPTDVQDILRGFAAGVNYFIEVHADELPEWATPDFSPQDIAARDLSVWNQGAVGALLRSRRGPGDAQEVGEVQEQDPDVGSNAWAFAPERTRSGRAILVRNPHLSYTSGYYEAHVTVPGTLNFYGDFRLGGPFAIIGGFNDRLGWSTTNNSGASSQVYSLLKDPSDPDAFLLDGAPTPIETRTVEVGFLDSDSLATATRDFRFTPLGPVLLETADTLFVLKSTGLRQPRIGEQWLRMMQAGNLEEWKEAMRIQAKVSSNFTYADADGNIFYVWNATIPILPHQPSDGAPVFALNTEDMWTDVFPWDSLPQLLNPKGGYLQNANDPPYFTNLNEPIRREDYPANFPEARVRLRSQHSLQLVHTDRVMSLEEVVELKHSMRMLLADRIKDDLLGILDSHHPTAEESRAIQLLADWDNRATRDSRGSSLFELWAGQYFQTADPGRSYLVPWSPQDPVRTPLGLGDEEKAVEAFRWAMDEAVERFGAWDVPWGEVHRIRAGELDIPVGGCPTHLGCFRVVGYGVDEDRSYRARTGDAWVLAVEFDEIPRAYSVLLYGNSNREESPYFYDQAEMFANNSMKTVAYTEDQIQRDLVETYRPGEERERN